MQNHKFIHIALITAGLIAGSVGMYLVSGWQAGPETEPSSGETPGERKIIYWRAPMNPNYISDKPGKSPMGMDLIAVYEDEDTAQEPGTVTIDPVVVQNIGVRTALVKSIPLIKTIRTVGRVDYDEKSIHKIHTKIEGWVEKLHVDFTGQEVSEGQILLEIYSPQLVSTQEEYLLARKYSETMAEQQQALPNAGSILALSRRRLELWDVPEHQIQELEETGKIMKTLHIHSPSKGIVIEKNVTEGSFVKPGMTLYTIADISGVWVYADIYEYETPWVKVGQEAEITLAAYPGRVFKGRVSFIYPFLDAKTRTNRVRLEFDNPKRELKPDMYANVTLKSTIGKDVLAIPAEAVIRSGERNIAIVSVGGGKFELRELTLGVEAGDFYQILEGLDQGEIVVTSSQFLIDSESRLKEAIGKMLEIKNEPGGDTPNQGLEDVPNEKMDMNMDAPEETMDHTGADGNMDAPEKAMDHTGAHGNMDAPEKAMDHTGAHGNMDAPEETMDHTGADGDMDALKKTTDKPKPRSGHDHSSHRGTKTP